MPSLACVLYAGTEIGNLYVIAITLLEYIQDLRIISSILKMKKKKGIYKTLSDIQMSTELLSRSVEI